MFIRTTGPLSRKSPTPLLRPPRSIRTLATERPQGVRQAGRPHIARQAAADRKFRLRLVTELKTRFPNVDTDALRRKFRDSSVGEISSSVKEAIRGTMDEDESVIRLNGPSKFVAYGLHVSLLKAAEDLGFTKPTEIQHAMMNHAIRGYNVVASARTGTGKTAAFGMPLIQRVRLLKIREKTHRQYKQYIETAGEEENVEEAKRAWNRYIETNPLPWTRDRPAHAPLAIVLCPTKELADQVSQHLFQYGKYVENLRIVQLFGALKSVDVQLREIRKGVDILVATPGRLLNLIQKSNPMSAAKLKELSKTLDERSFKREVERYDMDLSFVKCIVMDEVDRILSLGNMPDVKELFEFLPLAAKSRALLGDAFMQVIMISATIVANTEAQTNRFAQHYRLYNLNEDMSASDHVKQIVYTVANRRKTSLLIYFLKRRGSPGMKGKQVLVFCRTKQRVQRLTDALQAVNINAEALHRDQTATQRKVIVDRFIAGEIQLLIATDLMSRGIDIPRLPFVVNFDLPHTPEEYLHRIGRTARAGEYGVAVTLLGRSANLVRVGGRVVELDETLYMKQIQNFVSSRIHMAPKVPGPWKDESSNPEKPQEAPKYLTDWKRLTPENHDLHISRKDSEEKDATLRAIIAKHKERIAQEERLVEDGKKSRMSHESKHIKYLLENKKRLELRDFKEGRYDQVVAEFDRAKTVKRGVAVPSNFDKEREDLDRKRKERVEMRKMRIMEKQLKEKKRRLLHLSDD